MHFFPTLWLFVCKKSARRMGQNLYVVQKVSKIEIQNRSTIEIRNSSTLDIRNSSKLDIQNCSTIDIEKDFKQEYF